MDTFEELKKVTDSPIKYHYRRDYLNYFKTYSEGFNYWLNIPEEDRELVDSFIENIYCSCFDLGDNYDDSRMLRGELEAHCIYGKPFSMNAGLFENVKAIHDALNIGKSEATYIVIEAVKTLYEGQGVEVYWRDSNICPTEEEYKKAATKKSSAIPICHFKLMQLFSNNKTDYTDFTKRLGLYNQLVDDNRALADDLYQTHKGFLTDITQGKFTLPIIHAIEKEGSDPKLRNILRMHTDNPKMKQYALSVLKKHRSLEYAENVSEVLREELDREMNKLGGNPIFEKFDDLHQEYL